MKILIGEELSEGFPVYACGQDAVRIRPVIGQIDSRSSVKNDL